MGWTEHRLNVWNRYVHNIYLVVSCDSLRQVLCMQNQQQGLSGIFVMWSERRDIVGNILNYIFTLFIAYLTTLFIVHVTWSLNVQNDMCK
jgi:hypothetical protein